MHGSLLSAKSQAAARTPEMVQQIVACSSVLASGENFQSIVSSSTLLREWLISATAASFSLVHTTGTAWTLFKPLEKLFQLTGQVVTFTFEWTVWRPLAHVYLDGPSLSGYGFWTGLPPSEICAQISQVPGLHWSSTEANAEQCALLISRHFGSLCVIFHVLFYFFILWSLKDAGKYLLKRFFAAKTKFMTPTKLISSSTSPTLKK